MWKQIQKWCQKCPNCMRNKWSYKRAELLIPIEAPGNRPRAIVAYDLAVLPWSSQGYRYVTVIVDLFSKQIEAWPIKEKDSASVIEALENAWFNRHGIPNILLSDQESSVDGQSIREMCRRLGIQKRRSSAYHPQGDGKLRDPSNHLRQPCAACFF